MYLSIFVNGIDFAIVIEKHTEVVDVALHVVVLPRSLDVLGGVALESLAVHVREHVELSVGIADAGSPDALSVDFLMILQGEPVFREIELVEAVRDVLPVHEVFRMQNDQSGHRVHGGACQIVIFSHTENVGIAELVIKERIRERPVAVVGCPRCCLCICT